MEDLLILCAFLSNCEVVEPPKDEPIRAVIEAAEEYEVPTDLAIAFAFAESKFDCDAHSRAGARGVMQVMPSTARSLRHDVTRLSDCDHGARVGMEYLSMQLEACDGDWECAAENYNCGPNCKDRNNVETTRYKCTLARLLGKGPGIKCKGSI